MAGTNKDMEMSSNACNVGSRLVWGEGVRSAHESPPRRHGWQPGVEKFSVDSDCTRLRQPSETSRRWAWCLGEEGSGRHCAVRLWMQERKLVVVGESRATPATPATVFPAVSGSGPWKVHNRRVGHPSIGLDH